MKLRYLPAALLGLTLSLLAPLRAAEAPAELVWHWDVEVSKPLTFTAAPKHGETFRLEPRLLQYGAPITHTGSASFRYRSKKLDPDKWYTAPAAWNPHTSRLTVTFTPDMDDGSATYLFAFQLADAKGGLNYRASGQLRMQESPGFSAATPIPQSILTGLQQTDKAFAEELQAFRKQFESLHLIPGAPGPEGPQGPAGAPGPKGPQGPAGPVGPRGDAGPMGPQGPKGNDGAPGLPGKDGAPGPIGPQGLSAYDVARKHGLLLTEKEWIDSLHGGIGPQGPIGPVGPQGPTGPQGPAGKNGTNGKDGLSAYDIARKHGSLLSEPDWLASLRGAPGPAGAPGKNGTNGKDGASAYDIARKNGSLLSETDWLASLRGPAGPVGPQGPAGKDGLDGLRGPQGPKGDIGLRGAPGTPGQDGTPGKDGESAYELAVRYGYIGTEPEWVASLKGERGAPGPRGYRGDRGDTGPEGMRGDPGPRGPMGPEGPRGLPGKDGVIEGLPELLANRPTFTLGERAGDFEITVPDPNERTGYDGGVGHDQEGPYFKTVGEGSQKIRFLTKETDPTIPAWAKAPAKPAYAWTEITGLDEKLNTLTVGPEVVRAVPSSATGGNLYRRFTLEWTAPNYAKPIRFHLEHHRDIPTGDDAHIWLEVETLTDVPLLTKETDPTIPAWAKAPTKPTYTHNEITGLQTALNAKQPKGNYAPLSATSMTTNNVTYIWVWDPKAGTHALTKNGEQPLYPKQ